MVKKCLVYKTFVSIASIKYAFKSNHLKLV